jgi:hypothetical protein
MLEAGNVFDGIRGLLPPKSVRSHPGFDRQFTRAQALLLKHFSAPVDWCIWHYDRRPCPIAEISARIGDTKVSRHRQHSTSRRCS